MTGERKMFSIVNKTLLKNVIRHTDAHNKVLEEEEMWRQKEKERKNRKSQDRNNFLLRDRGADMRFEFSSSRGRRAHMDDEPQSTHWMRKLYKAEQEDKDRWGHSGFKELYPDKFESTSSSDSEDSYRKRNDRPKVKDRKQSRKRKHDHSSSSESDSEYEDRKKKKKLKKKHKNKDRHKEKKRKSKKRRHKEK